MTIPTTTRTRVSSDYYARSTCPPPKPTSCGTTTRTRISTDYFRPSSYWGGSFYPSSWGWSRPVVQPIVTPVYTPTHVVAHDYSLTDMVVGLVVLGAITAVAVAVLSNIPSNIPKGCFYDRFCNPPDIFGGVECFTDLVCQNP